MKITISDTTKQMAEQAASAGAARIREAISARGHANVIVATGASQLEMLENLIQETDIRWDQANVFHLDEYVGLSINHPASFRSYLWTRFQAQLPLPVCAFHYLNGEQDAQAETERVGSIIQDHPIDVAFIGIGENGHIAFNDPPADFETDKPYLVVELDEACRRQQFGEGWFKSIEEVPTHAISMSVKQIMKSAAIICTVPDERKAPAVRNAVEEGVSSQVPASILQQHECCSLYLDRSAGSLLQQSSGVGSS